jgi:predicted small metal-binding protein
LQEVLCPPCGTVIQAQTEDQLVEEVQAHAKQFHGHDPSREEILSFARELGEGGT